MRKFILKEEIPCPNCKFGKPCGKCNDGRVMVDVPLEEVLKHLRIDVPNTGYYGIVELVDDSKEKNM